MADTRENILYTALRLFARDGYEAVSVSTIAGELGMTKGALYKHYKNKRDIFDSIVARMYEIDAQRSRQYAMPESSGDGISAAPESIRAFTTAQYLFWTGDDFARDFRRMLTLEQYRSEEMAALYHSCITAGPVAYMTDIFQALLDKGVLRGGEARQMALAFYAPLFLLITVSDRDGDREAHLALLAQHIERFFQHYTAEDTSTPKKGI